jgi:hypothetical protein
MHHEGFRDGPKHRDDFHGEERRHGEPRPDDMKKHEPRGVKPSAAPEKK